MNHCLRLLPALFLVGCAAPQASESESLLPGSNVLPFQEIRTALKGTVDFSRHVKPIFQAKCVVCHDRASQPRGLHLDSRETAVRSGSLGVFIVPGNAKQSLLLAKINSASAHIKAMPPVGEQVTAEEVAILQRWITQGAVWPASE
ncbi:MAG: c-type cytochrome domain-containing protein [Prosthecobacter sp.]|nr:c-type cytochrome domain-containing protein [Prosthecobacter sp.]